MSYLRIPLPVDTPSFRLRAALEGVEYAFRFDYSGRADRWYMSLYSLDLVPIVLQVKLVASQQLLERVASTLRPPGDFFVWGKTPGFSDLARSAQLIYQTSDELDVSTKQVSTDLAPGGS